MVKLSYDQYDEELMNTELDKMTVDQLDDAFRHLVEHIEDESCAYLGHDSFAKQIVEDFQNIMDEMELRLSKWQRDMKKMQRTLAPARGKKR